MPRRLLGSLATLLAAGGLASPPAAAMELRRWAAPEAQAAIRTLTRGALLGDPTPLASVPPALRAPAGVFVTLSRDGVTRGCWGTATGREASLAAELRTIAPRALTRDRRMRPIQRAELVHLVAHVSVLGPLSPLPSLQSLDPRRQGLMLTAGRRGALVLPGEAATPAWAAVLCRRKAGIGDRVLTRMYRFETVVVGPIALGPERTSP
ncbi:MAG: AMMECR1 domain-containing protein [Candidatus Sericytochromatia bacterium]|nr:AMMECR1 domain-containing protein [Candidatus Sericytochromatia bacterium]